MDHAVVTMNNLFFSNFQDSLWWLIFCFKLSSLGVGSIVQLYIPGWLIIRKIRRTQLLGWVWNTRLKVDRQGLRQALCFPFCVKLRPSWPCAVPGHVYGLSKYDMDPWKWSPWLFWNFTLQHLFSFPLLRDQVDLFILFYASLGK